MPSTTSPSPGIRSPASQVTISPVRSAEPATFSILPFTALMRFAITSVLALRKGVGLSLPASFGHRFGEISEEYGEPKP